jgi:hypothetical protein
MNSKKLACVLLALVVGASVGCKRASGESCAKAEDCATGLTCNEVTHTCMTPMQIQADKACKEDCKLIGDCTADKAGECIAASDSDCQGTYLCEGRAQCTASGGKCIATSDADCKASDECSKHGFCTLQKGSCVAASDADCKASKGCTEYSDGWCTAKDGQCVKR